MLIETMRKKSETWWFRTFLFILVCLFIYQWGLRDLMIGSYSGSHNLASVGGRKINMNEFAQGLSRELTRLNINLKDNLSAEQQKQLYPYVLETMINNLLLERESERLGLLITDDRIKRTITEDQNFKTADGIFERDRFNNFLTNIHMSEKNFIEILRKDILRANLVQTLFGGITAPQLLTSRMYSYENQRRVLQVVSIESATMKLPKEPSEAEILDYYKRNPAKFTSPEYRDIKALILDVSLTQKNIVLTEARMKQYFEAQEEEFSGKTFDQVKDQIKIQLEKKEANEKLFDLSNKIDDSLAGNATLEEIAKIYGIKITTFSRVSAEGMYDPLQKTADLKENSVTDPLELRLIGEAFNEKEKETTKVIEDNEGKFFVARVDKVYAAHPMTYEESHDKAKTLLIQDLKSAQAKKIALEIESSVNAGGLFAMAVQEKGFKAIQIRVSRKGPLAPSPIYLPENFVSVLYHLRVGGAKATSYLNDNNQEDFIVGNVEKVEPMDSKTSEDKIQDFKKQLKGEIFNDLALQYIASLRTTFPVEYNNSALLNLSKRLS